VSTASLLKQPYDPATLTVIIIDDHDPIRKAIRRVLSGMGFKTIQEYFDGHDALKALAREAMPVDLIITDLYMRKVTGFQVLKKIRTKSYGFDIPIVVVTGEGSKEDIVKAVDLGADEYVLKPFQMVELEKKVANVLTKYYSPPPLLKLIRQGERFLIEKQYQDAVKLFEAAERLDPTSVRAQYCKAITLERLGHSADALKILKESSSNNPTFYKNYAATADIYLKLGHKTLAVGALKSELELNPRQAQRQTLLADLLMSEGDYLGGLEHYRLALRESQNMKEALLGMGKAYDATGNQEKAIYYFKRTRRLYPDFTTALDLLVSSYEAKKETIKVIPHLLEDIRMSPTQTDARVMASQLYVKFNDIEKALKILDDGLSRDSSSVALLKAKAKVLMSNRDCKSAITICKKIISIEPVPANYIMLGQVLTQDGQYKEAVGALLPCADDVIDGARALSFIADALKRSNNTLQAAFVMYLARAKNPQNKNEIERELKLLLQDVKRRRAPALTPTVNGGRKVS